jgi:hypothetical protein
MPPRTYHNFRPGKNGIGRVDDDVCSKCSLSRIFCREFNVNSCAGDKPVKPTTTVSNVITELELDLSRLESDRNLALLAFGRWIFEHPTSISYPAYIYSYQSQEILDYDKTCELRTAATEVTEKIQTKTNLIKELKKHL